MRIFLLLLLVMILAPSFLHSEEGHAGEAEDIYSLADRHFEQGLLEKAEEEYKEIIDTDPKYALAYNNLGVICSMDSARIKDGILYFIKAARLDPSYADPYNNLGILCYRTGEPDKGVLYLNRAIELDPDNFKYHFTLGWIYLFGLKNSEKAIEHFKKTIEFNEDFAEAYYVLGIAHFSLRKRAEVIEQVTDLRLLNREDLASALENIVRTPATKEEIAERATGEKRLVKTGYGVSSMGGKPAQTPMSIGKGRMTGSATIELRLQIIPKEGVAE